MSNDKNSFWGGLITGAIVSILTAVVTISVQHSYNKKEKTLQLYLDEKKDFVLACDQYLKQYRQWHELMNYVVYKDSIKSKGSAEFPDTKSAEQAFRLWKKDLDFSYGKIFLLSDNDFGYKTMEVSTVLHSSLEDLFYTKYDFKNREKILHDVDAYFFENWLLPAQEEIFRYNTGNRLQKSMNDFINEQKKHSKSFIGE